LIIWAIYKARLSHYKLLLDANFGGLKLAIRQKQTWVMAILGAAMSSTLLAFGAL